WELYLSLLRIGGKAFVIPEPLFHYQLRENSTTKRIRDIKNDKFQCIVLKHKDLYQKNFEDLVIHFTNKLKTAENETNRSQQTADFRLGKMFLKPLRFIKSLFS